jgi:hypothetical protein
MEHVLMMLPLLACAGGICLGLHFNILILLPFSVLGAGAFISSSIASGHSFLESAAALVVPMILLQAGYMLGLTARESYGQVVAWLSNSQSERI